MIPVILFNKRPRLWRAAAGAVAFRIAYAVLGGIIGMAGGSAGGAAYEADSGAGTRFFEALCAAHAQPPGDPLGELRTILTRVHNEQTYVLTTYTLCALTIKTFNAWRAGEQMRDLRFRTGEKFPVIRSAT